MTREYLSNHQGEKTSLSDVAKTIHVSTFYLYKIFKKATELNEFDFGT